MFILIGFCLLTSDVFGSQDFIVNTEKCKLPNYLPFTEDALTVYKPEFYVPCTKDQPISFVDVENNTATLKIRTNLFPVYGGDIACCYSSVERNGTGEYPDDSIVKSECQPVIFNAPIDPTVHTIEVICYNTSNQTVYQNVHNTFVESKEIKERFKKIPKDAKPISVLFVVIDSVARLNLIRTMWHTRDFLLDNGFIELKGYNKIDDNTYPNFMAFLTGFDLNKSLEVCPGTTPGNLDDCPMLWYKYRDLGYVTGYGEDYGSITTFNYEKRGFTKQPTDYYSRAYVLASEEGKIRNIHGGPYCTGPVSSGERQLQLAKDLTAMFKGKPYFGIYWMNTFSHNAINLPTAFDESMKTFFVNLKAEGVLDESIVIYLSDHGMRVDQAIRKTRVGWFEERLPLHLISVPRWFQEKFPTEYENLKTNARKLTSTYDLYMTLQHILELSGLNYTKTPAYACPSCKSLFEDVGERSCAEAGIPQEWCTCIGYLTPADPSNPIVVKAIDFVFNHIKSVQKDNHIRSLCQDYTLDSVVAGISSEVDVRNKTYVYLYLTTVPKAEYVIMVETDAGSSEYSFYNTTRLLRLGSYSASTKCVEDSPVSDYCYCKNTFMDINYLGDYASWYKRPDSE